MNARTFVFLFFIPFSLFAQNPTKEILSPQIHEDHTVTFRLDAKLAKSVLVSGDFVPGGALELAKDADGIWTATTAVLPSDLYWYSFTVDGVKTYDPGSPFVIRDVANIFNYFIVTGGKGDNYKVSDFPHGTVAQRWYDSPTLHANRRLTVYTPPGYENSRANYPVLYLLHGAGGDEEAWITLGRTAQIMDNLIAQGKARPMIVVMTNGNASQKAAPAEAPESMTKPVFLQPDMFSGNTEKAFPDVIRFIESSYRVKKDKSQRAIAGLSMGGMHSLVISANHPEQFGYVGIFSSAQLQPKDATAEVYANFDQKLRTQKSKGYKLYWIGIGKDDFLFKQCTELRAKLDSMGFAYHYEETKGGHSWSNWRDYLTVFVPQLFN